MVQHSRSKTKQEALEQSALDINKDTIYFTTDDHTIVMGGEEYSKCKVGNLDGYISQDATFLNRTTAGSISIAEQADGDIAQMTAVRGNSLVWNQLAAYGNFTDASKLSHDKDVSLSVSNNVLTVTRTAEYYNGGAIHTISSIYNHKYYCSVLAKTDANNGDAVYNNIVFYLNVGGNNVNVTGNLTTNWQRFSVIREVGATESSPISSTNTIYMYNRYTDLGSKVYFRDLILVDLSLMYGIGNEPDKATFEQWLNTHYPHGYYEYNKGEVISVKPTGIKTVGFNLYHVDNSKLHLITQHHCTVTEKDGEITIVSTQDNGDCFFGNVVSEEGFDGYLTEYAGIKDVTFPVLPNSTYVLDLSNSLFNKNYIQYWDKDYRLVLHPSGYMHSGQQASHYVFTTPSNVYYATVRIGRASMSNGQKISTKVSLHQVTTDDTIDVYQPYWEETTPINVTSLVGTKSDGTEEIMFPDGLMGIGEYKDEIKGNKAIKRIQKVDLGSLNWGTRNDNIVNEEYYRSSHIDNADCIRYYILCNKFACCGYDRTKLKSVTEGITWYHGINDTERCIALKWDSYGYNKESSLKETLKGVYAYYQLEEPIEYTLKTPFSVTYKADDYGTESILPDNGNNTPLTLPIEATIKYGVNVLGELENLPYNYVATYPQNLTDLQKETARHNIGVDLDRYAEKNGTYLDMTVGNAVNLEGGNEIVNNSAARPTGGNEDVTFDSSSVIKIEGNSVAWNQLAPAITEWEENSFQTGGKVTISNGEATIDANGVSGSEWGSNKTFGYELVTIPNHKYLYTVEYNSELSNNVTITLNFSNDRTDVNTRRSSSATNSYMWNRLSMIASYSTKYVNKCYMHITVDADTVAKVRRPMLFDLTLIYGAGKEPTTVEQFELDYKRWFGRLLEYENHNEGIIRPTLVTGIKTTGFNLSPISGFEGRIVDWYNKDEIHWDNVYGYQGEMCIQFGLEYTKEEEPIDTRNQALLHIIYTDNSYEHFYTNRESNPKLIFKTNKEKTVRCIKSSYRDFSTDIIKLTNICINFSWSGKRDGEYEPHWEDVVSLPITTITGKLNGEGESVVVFPDGMKRAGDVRDEIFVENGVTKAIKRVGSVDLGSLTFKKRSAVQEWGDYYEADLPDNYSNEDSIYTYIVSILCDKYTATSWGIMYSSGATDKSVCAGDRLRVRDDSLLSTTDTPATKYPNAVVYYPLAEPQVYTLNFSLPVAYRIDDYGTEEIVQPYDSIAPSYISTYGVNAVDTIRRLPKNYVSVLDQLFTEEQKATARRNIGAVSDEYYNELLKWHSYNNSVSSTTSVSTIPVNARLCIVNTTSGGTFGGTSSITKGQELHVIINNNGSSKITVNIPSTYKCDVDSIDIEAGKFGEVNCMTDGISIYCKAIGG